MIWGVHGSAGRWIPRQPCLHVAEAAGNLSSGCVKESM